MSKITLTKDQAEIVIAALSARATDEMRFTAWDVLDSRIKAAVDDDDVLDCIAIELDGTNWTPETLETVASLVRRTGRPVRDVHANDCRACDGTGEHETPTGVYIPCEDCSGSGVKPDLVCCDCGQPIEDAECMARNNGQYSHLDACPPAEAR